VLEGGRDYGEALFCGGCGVDGFVIASVIVINIIVVIGNKIIVTVTANTHDANIINI
jgi:hypothetical protein